MTRVAVVGSVNADLVLSVETLPKAGETIAGSGLQWLPGGKGANQAVAASRLGGDVRMYGAVGDDEPGRMCVGALAASGVDTSGVAVVSASTGMAAVVVDVAGENLIVVVSGANALVHPNDIADADVLLLQNEIPDEANFKAAKNFAGLVVYNPAPVREVQPELWDLVDVVIVNEHEHTHYARQQGLVVVTLGARGAVAYRDGVQVASATPPAVNVVDTVGAGDTFTAAFALAMAEGKAVDEAMTWAVAAGALATTAIGAQGAMPSRIEVNHAVVR